ncbi:MAG: response regulator, partial [Sphingomicrobium sp.]
QDGGGVNEFRRSAILIAAAIVLPVLLFAIFQAGFSARDQRRQIETQALTESQVVSAASDALVERSLGAMDALATVAAFYDENLARAYVRSREIAADHRDWVSVTYLRRRDGAILFDLRKPFSAQPAPGRGPVAAHSTALSLIDRDSPGCPCIVLERLTGGHSRRDGLLQVRVSTKPFERMLPPAGKGFEVSALVTGDGRFIARSLNQGERVGRPASKYVRHAVASGKTAGIYRGFTLEGYDNYTAFDRSARTGWSVHLAQGAQSFDVLARRFLGSMSLAAILSLALAIGLMWFVLRQLAQARRMTERSQHVQKLEALGQLTGGIAHDFNNLLTPIVGALDLLSQRSDLESRGRRLITGALAAAKRASKLTAQLLAFSRQQKLAIEPVDVHNLFDELHGMLEQSTGGTHDLLLSVGDDVGCVMGDRNQLELAILNLVINARDSSAEGTPIRVEAKTSTTTEGEERVLLEVIDVGEGMSAETRRRALEPFFTTKPAGRGTGLGLAQVFGVVQQSGGELEIDSHPGEGTRVSMALQPCAAPPAPRRSAATPAAAATRPRRILVVDDDALVRAAIGRLLEEVGHSVDSVADGRVALAAIDHCDYDLVIIDFAMPVMNGAQVIARAHKDKPKLRFLMVTGYADSDAVTAAAPDTPVLTKPFDNQRLMDLVAELANPPAG